MEDKNRLLQLAAQLEDGTPRTQLQSVEHPGENVSITSSERKKPLASAVESAWRKQTWVKAQGPSLPGVKGPPQQIDDVSKRNTEDDLLKTAESLQQFAIEQSESQHTCQDKSTASPSKQQLKFPPKPPKLRPSSNNNLTDSPCPDSFSSNDTDDFVIDTYVRYAVDSSDQDRALRKFTGNTAQLDIQNVGVLVIGEEDEIAWEAFAEDLEFESEDTDDEEEDENGRLCLCTHWTNSLTDVRSRRFLWK